MFCAPGLVITFWASELVLGGTGWAGPGFYFCAPEIVFGGIEGVGSRFNFLRSQTHFRRYHGRRAPFSCFARPDSFSAIARASDTDFMFCAPGLVFGGTEGVGYLFHVFRPWTYFRRYRGRRVQSSRFALPDSFSVVPWASGPVLIFCVHGTVFGGTEGVGSRFLVLRAQTSIQQFRGLRVPFYCFAPPDAFSAVPRASCPVFMFYALGLVFDGTEGVGSRLHVLRYRGVPFSIFARTDSFSAVSRALGPVFIFYAPKLIFDGTKGVGYRFHFLHARTHVRRYRGRRIPISCFSLPESFLAVPRASGPFSMFFAPGHIFGGTKVVGYSFNFLRS
jgi:hypothetical protein